MAKIGLVLSGGMAKGAYQIGVLKALRNYIEKENISYVSASSVGTLCSYAYITDNLELFEKLWLNNESFNIRNCLRSAVKRSNILDKVSELVSEDKIIEKDFFITCLNIRKMKLDYVNLKDMESEKVEQYLKAAISFIPAFKSIEIDGNKYLDGAVIDNIPVLPLSNREYDYLIVIHFDKNKYVYQNLINKNVIELNFNTSGSLASSLSFNMESSTEMIESGYNIANELFSDIFRYGADDLEYIYERLDNINSLTKKEKYNMSGDIAVDRLNNVAKKLVRYNMT